jgi:hypothetical protein
MSGIDWNATPAAYAINREQLDDLLSMPYDEPNMDEVERVCDEVRREPALRALCLQLSADLSLPLQCRFKLDHSGGHDWEIEKDVLTDYRAQQLREEQDTPSGMLPVRTPGAALRDAGVIALGPGDLDEHGRPAESILGRRPVVGRWVC